MADLFTQRKRIIAKIKRGETLTQQDYDVLGAYWVVTTGAGAR